MAGCSKALSKAIAHGYCNYDMGLRMNAFGMKNSDT